MDIVWVIYFPWVFKCLSGTLGYSEELWFITLYTYGRSGRGFVQTRATVKSLQSVLRLKSCGLLKGTEVNSLGAVDNATVNVGK